MKSTLFLFLFFFTCMPVHAELSGSLPGRGARISLQATLSVEAGVSWYTQQLRWSSVRLNAKLGRSLLSYVDLAKVQVSNLPIEGASSTDFPGIGYGGGLVFTVPDPFARLDFAFKAAFHTANINYSGGGAVSNMALHQAQWSTDFIISPIDPVFENGVSWYATLGYVTTSANANQSTESVVFRRKSGEALGFGITKPMARGSVYAGLAWLSGDPLVGLGIRYPF